ncbi:MAG: hypothetical protein HUJ56_01385, partial [Erysipelotrichaceae bacterium]|nr:hypothetical protein [Erysipelotrichaceae bacterium]
IENLFDKDFGKSFITQLNNILSENSTLTTTFNKTGKESSQVKLKFKNTNTIGISSLTANITTKTGNYTEPSVPAATSVITSNEFENLITQHYKMSDTEFEEVYNVIKDSLSDFTKEQLEQNFAEEKSHMTSEQLKKFNDLLNQAN